jgi:hypothetical protein
MQTARLTLALVERTTADCPDQWHAWTADGQYLYLRYRFGRGTADTYDTPDSDTWTRIPDGNVAAFHEEDPPEIGIGLYDFLDLAGIDLAPNAVVLDAHL